VLTIAFWNLGRKALGESVGRLIATYGIDLMVVAEYPPEVEALRATAATAAKRPVRLAVDPLGANAKTLLLVANPGILSKPVFRSGSGRISAYRIRYPLHPELLLFGLHLPSKLNWSEESRRIEAENTVRQIRQVERDNDLHASLLIGDFNMNPFETGMVATTGFHAVNSRAMALQGTRTVQSEAYRLYYNPTWSLMGDRSPGPPGSHHYSAAEHVAYHWHVYDQVLLSPESLAAYEVVDVAILEHNGAEALSHGGRPGGAHGSDHFPILIHLDPKSSL
jgi:hypothetical protein